VALLPCCASWQSFAALNARPSDRRGILAWQIAGIAAGFLTGAHHSLFGMDASHAYCATIRTGVLALGAVAAAWIGARWRSELTWLLYPMMALGAYRLVIDDMQQDRRAAMILSLVLYGAALMILPRIVNRPRSEDQHL
jgi:hypothetical protein